jgi:hypothetical protein
MRERKRVYRILVEKTERKSPFVRPGRRWEDNINLDVQEAECGGMD